MFRKYNFFKISFLFAAGVDVFMDWKYRLKEKAYQLISSKKLEPRYLVINCNPRSGSTWLFDAIRAHPAIRFMPSAAFSNRFHLQGNRYPADLSMNADGVAVELRPGRKWMLRSFEIEKASIHAELPPFCVEKFHPDFYQFNTTDFLRRVNHWKGRGIQFRFVLLVREPHGSLRSFVNYQRRNPKWFSQVPPEQAPQFVLNTYAALAAWKKAFEPLVIDYDDFRANPAATLSKVFAYCWPGHSYAENPLILEDAQSCLDATRSDKKTKEKNAFIAPNAPLEFTRELELQLDRMEEHYREIVG